MIGRQVSEVRSWSQARPRLVDQQGQLTIISNDTVLQHKSPLVRAHLLGSKVTALGNMEDGKLRVLPIANGGRSRVVLGGLEVVDRGEGNPFPLLARGDNVLELEFDGRERLGPIGGSLLPALGDRLDGGSALVL